MGDGPKTVFILGAGASCTYGLPTGTALKDLIASNPVPAGDIHPPLTPETYTLFRSALTQSGRSSVDAFLEAREDLMEIGKFAIAFTLLPLEKTKALFDDWPIRRVNAREGEIIPGNWYDLLFDMLAGGRTFEGISFADLGIITFNYDRSLEHYLHTALRHSYGKADKEAADKLDELHLIHVHGSLGRLPWQADAGSGVVPYGSLAHVLQARESLTVLHETMHDSLEFQRARELIRQAENVYFLGFGFHDANLKRLGLDNPRRDIFAGTVMGIAPTVMSRVRLFMGRTPESAERRGWEDKDVYNYLRDHVML